MRKPQEVGTKKQVKRMFPNCRGTTRFMYNVISNTP